MICSILAIKYRNPNLVYLPCLTCTYYDSSDTTTL